MKTLWSRRRVLSALGTGAFAGALGGLLTGCKHEKFSAQRVIQIGGPKGEMVFIPDRLKIKPGETVTWVLQSGGHTVTAYHPKNHSAYQARIPNEAEPWDSDLLVEKGATFAWTFDREGVYNYFCRPHESVGMVGAILVGRPLDGPGLALPQAELPALARKKFEELIAWAKSES
ncbi:halocyanin [Candidatus Acetothermia bacterium]|jgi:plastocyanin|nr:halocyanin [Candidatus Acetothermia bacterium]MCI2431483.1 halocyanin [Candidatus Acetothermia bacterium]MCI2436445.1 halocyanin [Candidatus Acetothermia bacterium]